MNDTHAPFRADEVGSLLRTAPLKDARAKRAEGKITPEQVAKTNTSPENLAKQLVQETRFPGVGSADDRGTNAPAQNLALPGIPQKLLHELQTAFQPLQQLLLRVW